MTLYRRIDLTIRLEPMDYYISQLGEFADAGELYETRYCRCFYRVI